MGEAGVSCEYLRSIPGLVAVVTWRQWNVSCSGIFASRWHRIDKSGLLSPKVTQRLQSDYSTSIVLVLVSGTFGWRKHNAASVSAHLSGISLSMDQKRPSSLHRTLVMPLFSFQLWTQHFGPISPVQVSGTLQVARSPHTQIQTTLVQ